MPDAPTDGDELDGAESPDTSAPDTNEDPDASDLDGYLPAPGDDAAPDSAPPAMDAASDAPELPLVQVSHASPANSNNLTAEGTVDWQHWGFNSPAAVNRLRNGPGHISMTLTQSATVGRYNDRPVRFSWTNGAPNFTVPDTPDGIVVGDVVGRGYEIRVTGDPTRARTVRVYVGVWGARARMNISLSGGTGTLYTDSSLTAQDPGADRAYTVVFQPAVQSQVLILRWTVDVVNRQYGNVTLQAVTLAD
jgi:hypothetical protein